MSQDVDQALKVLEAQDRENAGPARRMAERSFAFARPKLEAVRAGGEKAVDLIERGGVGYLSGATALVRRLQNAAVADAHRALDCVGQLSASRSAADAVTAQAGYIRAQLNANVERWRILARTSGAVAQAIETNLLRPDR